MIKFARMIVISSYMILLSFLIWLLSCGGSSIENPVRGSEEIDETLSQVDQQIQSLNVNVEVSKTTVQASETVEMMATVDEIRGTNIIFNWVNTTGYGILNPTNQNTATWTAPKTLDTVEVRVEILQLIVTAISQVVSVKESGVDTDTEVLTATKTILLTVTN
jgi:hypothetical protein